MSIEQEELRKAYKIPGFAAAYKAMHEKADLVQMLLTAGEKQELRGIILSIEAEIRTMKELLDKNPHIQADKIYF
jgi:hypothetical protein